MLSQNDTDSSSKNSQQTGSKRKAMATQQQVAPSEGNLLQALEMVAKEKGIDRGRLVKTVEEAILKAAQSVFGPNRELQATFNEDTGQVDLFQFMTVVDDVSDDEREIAEEDAKSAGLEAEIGEELGFQIFWHPNDAKKAADQDKEFGDLLMVKQARSSFGRIAAQTAKQVLIQRVRDEERDLIFQEFKDKKGDLIKGVVRRFEKGNNLIVDLGKAEGILPFREQTPRETYRPGDRIVALLKDIDREARGPQIILSRADGKLVEKLFESEVPEIYEGIVKIVACAREPGARSKIAVMSRDADVDPVGACVGMKGSRVQAVVQELRGEKIDIVPYDDDPARFVCNAIAPAEVSRVIIDAEGHRMELIVPDDKLSLAIGKKGQNVRLASQLTGWRIDIHSESKIYELERRAKEQIAAALTSEGFEATIADNLFKLGWRSVNELSRAAVEELAGLPGIGGPDGARKVIESARAYIAGGGRRRDDAAKESERRSSLSGGQQLMELDGVDEDVLTVLATANIHSPEDLIKTPIESIATTTGIDMGDLARLRQRAISWLSEVSS